ncbi:gluconate 2-dehydrogenase subunit 3 family protein [Robertkochia sediminum]|uniref:gluconate 2-dehydrogenase subunit 3 family protein n=1 Tax=Robertkochia sediminum TaxID=2785326 RepID=UPI001931D277|nr:gluconate 2-dehydrogenase subunit 3 family protein [Robertkochia sediminum]MBL7473870.1 gluconate 2-dehydrogenase subunit 3 family protein [Robertkochia sediminum]
MDRRKSIKAMFAGTVTSGFMFSGCLTEKEAEAGAEASEKALEPGGGYGRTPEELERDQRLMGETFFNEEEMAMIAVLADLIIPADETSGSATDAGVPDFIEFIVKDMPYHQTPLRGGLMWLNHESNRRYDLEFVKCSEGQQKAILDDIAYPDEVEPEYEQGARFFSRIRNLVATGFFTSKMGIDDLGYMGNVPNVWDGVPADVLEKHGMEYDEKILKQSIKPEERNDIEDWKDYEV